MLTRLIVVTVSDGLVSFVTSTRRYCDQLCLFVS